MAEGASRGPSTLEDKGWTLGLPEITDYVWDTSERALESFFFESSKRKKYKKKEEFWRTLKPSWHYLTEKKS